MYSMTFIYDDDSYHIIEFVFNSIFDVLADDIGGKMSINSQFAPQGSAIRAELNEALGSIAVPAAIIYDEDGIPVSRFEGIDENDTDTILKQVASILDRTEPDPEWQTSVIRQEVQKVLVETNKIPRWAWAAIGVFSIAIIALIIKIAKK